MAGVQIPIVPIRRQMFTTDPLKESPGRFPVRDRFCAVAVFPPRGRGIADRHEQSKRESPASTRMWTRNSSWSISKPPSSACRCSKSQPRLALGGLYEVTPDAHPIYGKTNVEGFLVCTGFSGHGFMHGPVSGKLMSELIRGWYISTLDVSMLDLARFEEGRLIKEYNVV
jgi:sarcosine oxidase, subunit beta